MQWTKVKFIPIEHTKYIHIARANTIYGKNAMSETETTKNTMNKPKNVSVKWEMFKWIFEYFIFEQKKMFDLTMAGILRCRFF